MKNKVEVVSYLKLLFHPFPQIVRLLHILSRQIQPGREQKGTLIELGKINDNELASYINQGGTEKPGVCWSNYLKYRQLLYATAFSV